MFLHEGYSFKLQIYHCETELKKLLYLKNKMEFTYFYYKKIVFILRQKFRRLGAEPRIGNLRAQRVPNSIN